MHVVVIFGALSPYHRARIRAAECMLEKNLWKLTTIERVGWQKEYPWFGSKQLGSNHSRNFTLERAYADTNPVPSNRESVLQVWRLLERLRPDCVVFGYPSAVYFTVLKWCVRSGIPAVQLSESTVLDFTRYSWKEWIKSRVTQLYSSGFAAGSRTRDYLVSLGMPCNRIAMGYGVVDNEHFRVGAGRARAKAEEMRTQLRLPEHYFIAAARFVEKKNLLHLLEAYGRYVERCEGMPWSFVLMGDGPLRERLERAVNDLGLIDQVSLPGLKEYEELPKYYGLASAFILASTGDQWGLVVNEAMASGLPVLVSERCGCAPDLVHEGVNGFTFNPFDVEHIAAQMLKIAADNSDWAAMGRASEGIITHWTPETFAKGLMEAVEHAMNAPRPGANLLDKALLWALAPK